MARLTHAQRQTLKALEGCTAPWNARARTNRARLAKLHLMGFASWVDGGWIITEAGRAALSSKESELE